MTLVVGLIFLVCGIAIARRAYLDDIANQSYEAILFGVLGALVGLFLLWVTIFGPPG